MDSAWEMIIENIQISAKNYLDFYEQEKHMP
jgi:hypothetical protein